MTRLWKFLWQRVAESSTIMYELQMLVWILKKALDYHELVLGAVACKTPIERKPSAPPSTHVTWFHFFALFSSLFLVLCYICKFAATACQGLPDATLSLRRRATVLSAFLDGSLKSELLPYGHVLYESELSVMHALQCFSCNLNRYEPDLVLNNVKIYGVMICIESGNWAKSAYCFDWFYSCPQAGRREVETGPRMCNEKSVLGA